MVAYTNWVVGDIINICAQVEDYCGFPPYQYLYLKSSDMQKNPNGCTLTCDYPPLCTSTCINTAGRQVIFKSIRHYTSSPNDVNCNNVIASHVYREIGSTVSNSTGTASIQHQVSDQDRLDYLDTLANGQSYKIVYCINDSSATTGHAEVYTVTIAPQSSIEATHIFELGIKPYSWKVGTALADVISKLTEISGGLANLFTTITDYQYITTEATQEGDYIVIRVYMKHLQITGMGISTLNPIAFVPMVVLIAALILVIGAPVYYFFRDIYRQLIGQQTYTPTEVNQIVWGGGEFGDGVVKKQLEDCDTNFSEDPNGLKNCYKSVLCGATDGMVDALALPTSIDCTAQQVNTKIDDCYSQYLIDHNLENLKTCMNVVKTETGGNLQTEADKKTQTSSGFGMIMLAALALGTITLVGTMKSGPKGVIEIRTEGKK